MVRTAEEPGTLWGLAAGAHSLCGMVFAGVLSLEEGDVN